MNQSSDLHRPKDHQPAELSSSVPLKREETARDAEPLSPSSGTLIPAFDGAGSLTAADLRQMRQSRSSDFLFRTARPHAGDLDLMARNRTRDPSGGEGSLIEHDGTARLQLESAHRYHASDAPKEAMLWWLATVVALVQSSTEARAAAATASQTQVEQGRTLYLEGCASCHGLEAQGTSTAPSLIGVGAAAVHFQVATGRMPLAAPTVQAELDP